MRIFSKILSILALVLVVSIGDKTGIFNMNPADATFYHWMFMCLVVLAFHEMWQKL